MAAHLRKYVEICQKIASLMTSHPRWLYTMYQLIKTPQVMFTLHSSGILSYSYWKDYLFACQDHDKSLVSPCIPPVVFRFCTLKVMTSHENASIYYKEPNKHDQDKLKMT